MAQEVTLDEFKAFLERDIADTELDTILQISLDSAFKFVETYCNLSLINSEVVYKPIKPISDSKELKLPYYPVLDVVEVKFKNTIQDITKFYIDDFKILKSDIPLPTERNSVEIKISVGYKDIPSDLRWCIFKIADKMFKEATDNMENIRGYDNGIKSGEDYIHTDLPDTVEMILIRYKKFYL